MHIRWWNKGFGGKCEESFRSAVELKGDGEQAVVPRSRPGSDAVGDFALDHEDSSIQEGGVFREKKQDRGGDVVWQISDDEQGLTCIFCGCREIELKYVLPAYGYIEPLLGRKAFLEGPGEFAVELNGDQMFCFGGKKFGDGAFAGPNFNDGTVLQWSQRGYDALNGLRIS